MTSIVAQQPTQTYNTQWSSNGVSSHSSNVDSYSSAPLVQAPNPYQTSSPSAAGTLSGLQQPNTTPPTPREPHSRNQDHVGVTAADNAWAEVEATGAEVDKANEALATAIANVHSPELADKVYASSLNGMTSTQLGQEKASIERELNYLPAGSAERQALQKKLDLVNAELNTRPKDMCARIIDDRAREALQNQYANMSNEALQSELGKLFQQCSISASGTTPSAQNNLGKDSEIQGRIGAIQAQLIKNGVFPVTPEILKVKELTQKANEAKAKYDEALGKLQKAEKREELIAEKVKELTAEWEETRPLTYTETLHVLKHYFYTIRHLTGDSKYIQRGDLEHIRNNPGNFPPELVRAAQFLLANLDKFHALDIGRQQNDKKADGDISMSDIDNELSRNNCPTPQPPCFYEEARKQIDGA